MRIEDEDYITKQDFEDYKEVIKKRDYLIRTNFIGTLSNEKLVKEMQSFISRQFTRSVYSVISKKYESVKSEPMKTEVLEFNEFFINYVYDELEKLEEKQKILDKYGE